MYLSISVSDCVGLISGGSVCVFVCISVSDCDGLISGCAVCLGTNSGQ